MKLNRLERIENFPLHKSLGIEKVKSAEGKGSFEVEVTDAVANPNNILHGGVLYLLCDVCAYSGLLSLLSDKEEAVTHDIHVSVLRAAFKGDVLKFSSETIKKGRSVCFMRVEVRVKAKIIATATVTKSIISI